MADIDEGSWHARSTLRISLLGSLVVELDGRPLERLQSGRTRTLLEVLALHHPLAVPRDVLIDTLWPDMDLRRARNNLNVTIHAARRALRPAPSGALGCDRSRGLYHLGRDVTVVVDVCEFRRLVSGARAADADGDHATAVDLYRQADAVYTADLLAEQPYAEWIEEERRVLRRLRLDCLDRLGELLGMLGRRVEAGWVVERQATVDPLDERAAERHIRLLLDAGEIVRATRAYHDFEQRLFDELGLAPSPRLVALGTKAQMESRAVA